jgi:hypothetical protein
MENSRKLVLFPVDQFYAVVGTISMAEDPYSLTITDIFNDKSSATHGARDHLHRPGRIYLSNAEFYALKDNRRKVCCNLDTVHLAMKDVRAVIDFFPDRFKGNPLKRKEYEERKVVAGSVRFSLHAHVLSGVADERDIYRQSEQFIGLTRLRVEEVPVTDRLSLPGFLELIGCQQPDYMAVNLARVFHS